MQNPKKLYPIISNLATLLKLDQKKNNKKSHQFK